MRRKLKRLHVILSENEYERHLPSCGIYFPKLDIYYESVNSLLYHDKSVLYPESFLEPLPEKEEWFEVFAWHESNIRPQRESYIFRSVEEFLKTYNKKESEFHWIKLRKIEID